MNATCQSTNRFYIKYRCLPVIQNENHYQCDSTVRRNIINLSCENSFRLYIKMALVGISTQQSSALCDKNTYWVCNHYVPDSYRNVCNNRLSYAGGSQCDIHYNDRPRLKACPHGELSNFSMIEYLCIPGFKQISFFTNLNLDCFRRRNNCWSTSNRYLCQWWHWISFN